MCLKTTKFKNSKKGIDKFDNFTRPKNRNKKKGLTYKKRK